jgi:hypothetical protein
MIRAVWESPTNEGTSYYELGNKKRQIPGTYDLKHGGYQYEWEVGRIVIEYSDFGEWRIIVIDSEGKRRVSLPAAICSWEWDPEDGDGD